MHSLPDLLTPHQVASVLKVHHKTLAVWRRRQQGPPFIIVEGRVRYPSAWLCDYLDERTVRVG